MTPRPTRDVSHLYGTFGAHSGTGGDLLLLANPGSIDQGRAELHERVEAEMAATGDPDYSAALDRVLGQARHGLVTLSAAAREGLGLPGDPGRGRGPAGPVRTLSAAPDELPERPEAGAVFRDAMAFCQTRKPSATEADHGQAVKTVMARSGSTGGAQVQRWLSQGGREGAFG